MGNLFVSYFAKYIDPGYFVYVTPVKSISVFEYLRRIYTVTTSFILFVNNSLYKEGACCNDSLMT